MSSSSGSDDSSGVDVVNFIDDEAEEGEEEDGEVSEVVSSEEEEEEGWVLEEAVEGHTTKRADVVEGSGDEEMQSDVEEVSGQDETGDEEEVQTGDEDVEVQTGDEDEAVQTGDEDEAVQTGDEDDEDVQTGDEDEEVQTGDEDEEVKTGDEDAQAGSQQLRWKEGLEHKARKSFELRKSDSVTLRRLIYEEQVPEQAEEEDIEFGGLFTTARKKHRAAMLHEDDSSLTGAMMTRDWTDPVVAAAVKRLFVTGEWEDGDAQRLLAEDEEAGEEEDEEADGDFEDLETGEKHKSEQKAEKGMSEQERLEKKKELKTHFDTDYDDVEGASYLDELKQAVSEQAELNRKEFEDMDDESRVAFEGLRPGLYVRMEIKGEWVESRGWTLLNKGG